MFSILYKLYRSKGFRILYKLFCFFPIKKNRILFASDSSDKIHGNFKYILDELQSQKVDLDLRIILKQSINSKKTLREITLLAYYIATSRYILLDDFYPMIYPLRIREGADLIQVWHAVGAFKKFGYSRLGLPGGPSPNSLNHRNYTKVIVSSKNVVKHYAEGFGISEQNIYPIGVPRTDVFFSQKRLEKTRYDFFKQHPYLKDRKIILFAPTFRGNGQSSAFYPREKIDFKLLYENLKDEYVVLIKLHPFVKLENFIPQEYKNFIYDFSDYEEVNDLLFISDLLITDYSSVCFEFALLKKPMIFYAFDLEEYTDQRDFYYEYQSFVPGNIAKSTSELVQMIKESDFAMEKLQPFIEYFYDHKDGNASKRFVEELLKF